MIMIEGSEGEGGGQILRSALVTGTPFRIDNIRAKRAKFDVLRGVPAGAELTHGNGDEKAALKEKLAAGNRHAEQD